VLSSALVAVLPSIAEVVVVAGAGTLNLREWTLREWTIRHDVARLDSAGVDNAGVVKCV